MKSSSSAFTIVELMIIVALLSDLVIIALPAFTRARDLSQNTKFINDLRTATAAFEVYSAEHALQSSTYPADAGPGVIPTGMREYLLGMNWTDYTPIGGRWDWEPTATNPARLGVNFVSPAPVGDDVRMSDIDARLDNGVLTTGGFRKTSTRIYLHTIE